MPRNVVIVGPPRSGTSLTSDIFARQSYFTGKPVMEGDDYNPFGYYEAEDVIEANVGVFKAAGFEHHNTWKFDAITEAQIAALNELEPRDADRELLARWNGNSPWMWKDPRFSISLGYWAKLLDWNSTGVILTLRDAEDVYWSWRRKGWAEAGREAHDAAIARIEQHANTARETVERLGVPHIAIEYSEYKECPDAVAARISEFVGLQLTVADLNFHSELDHSSGHSRLAGHVRILLRKLPRGPLKKLAGMLPRRVQAALLPERGFVATTDTQQERRAA